MSSVLGVATGTAAAPSPALRRAQRDRWFFSGMAVAAAAAILVGFSPTYFHRPDSLPPLSSLVRVHGALFTSWILLLVIQTTLVAARRTDVHRRLGIAGGVLLVAMIVVGYAAGIDAARRGSALPGMTPQAFLIIPLAAIAVFTVLAGAALVLRRRPDYHKRLMLLATTELLTAAIARIPAIGSGGPPVFFGATDAFVLALVAYDAATLRRVHPATLWGGLFLIVTQPLRMMAAGTGSWLALATWLTS